MVDMRMLTGEPRASLLPEPITPTLEPQVEPSSQGGSLLGNLQASYGDHLPSAPRA